MKLITSLLSRVNFFTFVFFIALCTLIVTMQSVIGPSFFRPHDYTHAARLVEMQRSLQSGEFPVRWSRNFGFGYGMPLFNFYAPLPYYIGQIPLNIGVSSIDTIKFLYVLNGILAFIGMYLLARKMWGNWGGVISAIAFSFSTYRAVDLFVRGAIGEAFALVLLPFALYGVVRIVHGMKYGWLVTGLSLGAILLSHNLIGMISIVLTGVWWAATMFMNRVEGEKLRKGVIAIIASVVCGVGISAFYILPAYFQKSETRVDQTITVGYFDYHNHFLCFRQLLTSPWGYTGSNQGCVDGIGFSFGTVGMLMLLCGVVFVVCRGHKLEKKNVVLVTLFLLGSVFMTIGRSQFIWDHIALLKYFQFPWRFLTFAHVFFALGIGTFASLVPKNWAYEKVFIFGAFILIAFFSARFYMPEKVLPIFQLGQYYDTSPGWIRESMSKTLNDYLPPSIVDASLPAPIETRIESTGGNVIIMKDAPAAVQARIVCPATCEVKVNIFQFPGWKATIDGKESPLIAMKTGLPIYVLQVPAGEHTIDVALTNTFITQAGNGLTLATVLLLSGYFLFERRKGKRHHV